MKIGRRTVAAAILASAAAPSAAVSASRDRTTEVIQAAAKALREEHYDVAAGARLGETLVAAERRGAYRGVPFGKPLADKLTDDIFAASRDRHLQFSFDPPAPMEGQAEHLAEDDLHPRFVGWGVQTVARLPGNIGLLRVTHFPSPPSMFDSRYAAAMELLQDTSALILDLTVNHGGGTDTTGYFLSYFLHGDVEFGRLKWRSGEIDVVRTYPEAPGRRYGAGKPMFVAISSETFSAGEAIAQHLHGRGRATLVGGRTKGGAHPGNWVKLPHDFRLFVVMGQSEGGPDWEGVGVKPDVEAPAQQAVEVAYGLALDRLMEQESDAKRAQVFRNVKAKRIENLSNFNL